MKKEMPEHTTREKIIMEALNLFAKKGYEAASVRDIAAAVGIKDSSLYNHFKSKREIFDAIVALHISETDKYFQKFCNENDCTKVEVLFAATEEIMEQFMQECAQKTIRMLQLEMYSKEESREIYQRLFFKEPFSWCDRVFEELIKAGRLKRENRKTLACQFYAPLFFILKEYDIGALNALEAKKEAMEQTKQFIGNYGIRKEEK